jgi:hypothetical protein
MLGTSAPYIDSCCNFIAALFSVQTRLLGVILMGYKDDTRSPGRGLGADYTKCTVSISEERHN